MQEEIQILTEAYNAGALEEYQRLADPVRKRAEFDTVCQLVESKLQHESVIIDIGCGPGRYAEHFLKLGHKVGCVDLSARSLKMFSDRISNQSEKILFNQVSCATNLDWIDDNIADVILLMGPMYHLTNLDARQKTLQQCFRILKPDGYLIVMYMSPVGVFEKHPEHQNTKNTDSLFGFKTTCSFQSQQVPQFRSWPSQAKREAAKLFSCAEIIEVKEEKRDNFNLSQLSLEIKAEQFLMVLKPRSNLNNR